MADMQITVDALKLGYERDSIDAFVFVSADRDFIPVIKALQGLGKEVVVIGDEQITSGSVKEYGRRFVSLNELAGGLKSLARTGLERTLRNSSRPLVASSSLLIL